MFTDHQVQSFYVIIDKAADEIRQQSIQLKKIEHDLPRLCAQYMMQVSACIVEMKECIASDLEALRFSETQSRSDPKIAQFVSYSRGSLHRQLATLVSGLGYDPQSICDNVKDVCRG